MKKFISKQLNKNDKLIKHSLIVFIAVGIGSFFNYVFQLYMGRALGPAEYGVLGALFSVYYALNVPSGTIQTVVTKFVSEFKAKNGYGKIRRLFGLAFKKIFFYGLIFLVVFILISGYISSFLKIPKAHVIALGIVLFLSFLYPIFNGMLRGLQKFNWFSISGIIQPALKLGLGILLVSLGFGVFGAVNALNFALVITILIILIPLGFLFKHKKESISKLGIFKYGFFVFLGVEGLMLITNMDMFLVKHFFSSLDAGYYAAASMLSKIPWFASGAIVAVMFPKISDFHTKKKDSSKILKSTLFYTFLISFSLVLVYFVAPTFVTRMLYGSEYLYVKNLIGYFALGLSFFALNNVLAMYNFAVKKTRFIYFILLVILIEFFLIWFIHNTLLEIIKIVVIANIALFFILMIYTRKELGINAS